MWSEYFYLLMISVYWYKYKNTIFKSFQKLLTTTSSITFTHSFSLLVATEIQIEDYIYYDQNKDFYYIYQLCIKMGCCSSEDKGRKVGGNDVDSNVQRRVD